MNGITLEVGHSLSCEENIMAVFRRAPREKPPWMPRMEHWYHVNSFLGKLPPRYRGMSLVDIYKDLNACWRCYMGYYTESAVEVTYEGEVEVKGHIGVTYGGPESRVGRRVVTVIKTPLGELRQVEQWGEWGFSSRIVEYPVKSVRDFKILSYVLENMEVRFNYEKYRKLEAELKGQGMIWYFFPRTPLQRLLIDYVGIERTYKFLFRHRAEVEDFMEVIKQTDDKFYRVMAESPIKVFNFGDNIDARITPPKLFEKYCLPYYQERSDFLHKRGKFIHCHVDGYAKPLLPFFKEAGWDGVEALTARPVGDMTLEEIKKALGDELILIDGIPYIYFLPTISYHEFEKCVKRVLELFWDNLILGISDELPPTGDIERVRRVPMIIDEVARKRGA